MSEEGKICEELLNSIKNGSEVYIGKTVRGQWSVRGQIDQVIDPEFHVAAQKYIELVKTKKPEVHVIHRRGKTIDATQLG